MKYTVFVELKAYRTFINKSAGYLILKPKASTEK